MAELSNEGWGKQFSSVSKFIGSRIGQKPKLSMLRQFFEWLSVNGGDAAGKTPDVLIEFQKDLRARSYELKDPEVEHFIPQKIVEFLNLRPDWRRKYKKNVASSIYALFEANLVPLPRNGEVRRAAKSSTVKKTNKDQWVDVEGLNSVKRMIDGDMNSMYKAVFMCMLTSGMGMDEVVEWSNQGIQSLERALETGYNGRKIVKISLSARKDLDEDHDFFTFIFAKDALKLLREWVEDRRKLKDRWEKRHKSSFEEKAKGAVFLTRARTPLNAAAIDAFWLYRARKLKIYQVNEKGSTANRYGFSPHILRSFFKSWWTKSKAQIWLADLFMGHIVDQNSYERAQNDPKFLSEELDKAEDWLNILSSPTPFYLTEQSVIEASLQRDQEIIRLKAELKTVKDAKVDSDRTVGDLRASFEVRNKRVEAEIDELKKKFSIFIDPELTQYLMDHPKTREKLLNAPPLADSDKNK